MIPCRGCVGLPGTENRRAAQSALRRLQLALEAGTEAPLLSFSCPFSDPAPLQWINRERPCPRSRDIHEATMMESLAVLFTTALTRGIEQVVHR
jgi:hypothetical protein